MRRSLVAARVIGCKEQYWDEVRGYLRYGVTAMNEGRWFWLVARITVREIGYNFGFDGCTVKTDGECVSYWVGHCLCVCVWACLMIRDRPLFGLLAIPQFPMNFCLLRGQRDPLRSCCVCVRASVCVCMCLGKCPCVCVWFWPDSKPFWGICGLWRSVLWHPSYDPKLPLNLIIPSFHCQMVLSCSKMGLSPYSINACGP